jgi:hypothetical protein
MEKVSPLTGPNPFYNNKRKHAQEEETPETTPEVEEQADATEAE